MNNLLTRALAGAVFLILVIGSILLNFYAFALFLFVVNILALHEFYVLINSWEPEPRRFFGFAISSLVFFIAVFLPDFTVSVHIWVALLLVLLISILFLTELFGKSNAPFHNISVTLLGIFYVTLPLCAFILASNICSYSCRPSAFYCDYSKDIPIGIFVILWTNDTIAYLAGSAFGKHKLFPEVSPKKSWEGLLAGSVAGIAAAYIVSRFFDVLTAEQWLITGLIITIFSPVGDLCESLLKRKAGVKNSGAIMPGHGGALDRFDGLLIAAPVIWWYLTVIRF